MTDQIRVLYLIGQFPAINHSYLLAEVRNLRSLGLDVSVISVSLPDRPPEKLSPQEREEAARTYYLKSMPLAKVALIQVAEFFRRPLSFWKGLFFAMQLAGGGLSRTTYHLVYFAEAILVGRRVRELGVSHVHASFSATVALIAARIFPLTMSFGVYGFGELHNPLDTRLEQRVRGALFVRSNSRFGCGQLMLSCDRSEWSKLVYVPLGIDASEFASGSPRTIPLQPHLLCVGRLAPEKGQALLLEAVAALKMQGCSVLLRLVGDGPDRKWLEIRAAELGITSNLEFNGWVSQERLVELYRETDLFVLPSLAEGIPTVLMEAMAMEIPCVAPCIAGIPELIQHGVDGMLFAVADVEDLNQQIQSLLKSPELRARIGRQARIRVMRDYDMTRNSQRFATVLIERLRRSSPTQ